MELELTEAEKRQLGKLRAMRMVAFGVVAKWFWPAMLIFSAALAVFGYLAVSRGARSVQRFTAETALLYHPHKVPGIEPLSAEQLMPVIENPDLKRKVGDMVPMSLKERESLSVEMKIEQKRDSKNLFRLYASSQEWKTAVKKVNSYADLLVDVYVEFRNKDLESRRRDLESRRDGFMEELEANGAAEAQLKARTSNMSPQDVLIALNTRMADERRNVAALEVDAHNEELKIARLGDELGGRGETVQANSHSIRRMAAEIAAVERDIEELRKKNYTDINPKLQPKIRERDDRKAALDAFLKEKGIEGVNLDNIDSIERAADEYAESTTRKEAIERKRLAILQTLKDDEKRAAELASLIPEYETLEKQKLDLNARIKSVDEDLNTVSSAQASLRNDLRQISQAGGAGDKGILGMKRLFLAFGASSAIAGSFLFLALVLELLFGNIRGRADMAAYDWIQFIGSLPREGALDPDEDREVCGVVAQKLMNSTGVSTSVVCRLPGAEVRKEFHEAVGYASSMAGISMFTVSMVRASGFTPPEGAEQMIGIVRLGDEGWFPVANRLSLAPAELQMLKADLETLKETYDRVIFLMEEGVRIGGTFIDQMIALCDEVVIEAGCGATRRSVFSYIRRKVETAGKPVKAIATGARASTVRRETETKI